MKNSLPDNFLPGLAIVLISTALTLPAFLNAGARPQNGTGSSSTAPAGEADIGKKIYHEIGCWQCHGYSAQGGSAGPPLVPDPLPFPAFTEYVRAPAGEMPPYTAKVLTDGKLADIYAFLEAIPPPPKVEEIPLLNREEN